MNSGFRKIMWGLIFILLNINIIFIDIFPDFVGYILIALGAKELTNEDAIFSKISSHSTVLCFLSIVTGVQASLFPYNDSIQTSYSFVLSIINLLIDGYFFYLIYLICNSIYNYAFKNSYFELMQSARFKGNFLVILFLVQSLFLPFLYNIYIYPLQIIGFILVVLLFFTHLSIIFLVKSVYKTFNRLI